MFLSTDNDNVSNALHRISSPPSPVPELSDDSIQADIFAGRSKIGKRKVKHVNEPVSMHMLNELNLNQSNLSCIFEMSLKWFEHV